ncbi:hypothetical protein ND486_28330 [Pseudonocardia sp. DR1-2]|uniref:HipA family kinase n=1 Tax=Pseudonocardia sp. DR1-2 TaxID=2951168 RepID=UPI00204470CB|nr:HipA family kinase [Pseudonocardia sp. DR1-2]MCM3850106.1 hypothetical protein [Pseudonocardia sp. DR1-2]
MTREIDGWEGLLSDQRGPTDPPELDMLVDPSSETGSHAFKARSTDGTHWYVKVVDSPRSRAPATDLIVSSVAQLIGAPVPLCSVVEIPPELEGEAYAPGRTLTRGLAFGSREVVDTFDGRKPLQYRGRDDNRRRQAGMFALYDWCWGQDVQWLYSAGEDLSTHSIDHAFYLPRSPEWSASDLRSCVDEPHAAPWPCDGLSPAALENLADTLETLTREALSETLRQVPAQWPVSTADLETVGWFLDRRRQPVAERLRRIAMITPEGGAAS